MKIMKAFIRATFDALVFFLLCSITYFFVIPVLIIFEWFENFKYYLEEK